MNNSIRMSLLVAMAVVVAVVCIAVVEPSAYAEDEGECAAQLEDCNAEAHEDFGQCIGINGPGAILECEAELEEDLEGCGMNAFACIFAG